MNVVPSAIIDLGHRAYFLRRARTSEVVLAASENGIVSVINDSLSANAIRIGSKLRAISPHPSDPLMASVDGFTGGVAIQSMYGERMAEIAPPRLDAGTPSHVQRGFSDCHFDEGADLLWLASHLSEENVELRLVDTRDWSLVDRTVLHDPFGESHCAFFSTQQLGLVGLWMAAGQNGQEIFWLRAIANRISCDQEFKLTNTNPPAFSPDGSKLLVIDECSDICQYEFSTGQKLGSRIESRNEDPFAESICYFDERQAFVATHHGRVFLIDTYQMGIVDEVVIKGHEPKPICEYYPQLVNDRALGTDIGWFVRTGDDIAFIFRRDGGVRLEGWKDSIVWCHTK